MGIIQSHYIWLWKKLVFFCFNIDSDNSQQYCPQKQTHTEKKKKSINGFCFLCYLLSFFSRPFLYAGPCFLASTRQSHNSEGLPHVQCFNRHYISVKWLVIKPPLTFQVIRFIISLWTPLNSSDYELIYVELKSDFIVYFLSALVVALRKPSYD